MKACVMKDVKTFEVRDIPLPTLKDDEILLKVNACSICGSDPTMSQNPAYIGRVFGHEVLASGGTEAMPNMWLWKRRICCPCRIVSAIRQVV